MKANSLVSLLIIVLLCICGINGLEAQKVTVSPEVLLRDDYSFALLGEVEDKVLLVRNKGYNQALSIYNEGLGFVQEVPLEFEERKVNLIGFVTNDYDFTSYYSYRNGSKEYVKAVKMSAFGEKFYEDTLFVRENVFISEYYNIYGSSDDRYVLVSNIIDDGTLHLMLYDNQEMELLFENKLAIQGVSMRTDLKSIKLTKSGKVGILFEKYNSMFRKDAHHFRLITIDPENEILDTRIDFQDKYSVSVALMENDKKNSFEILGLYGNRYENMSNGYFLFDGEVISVYNFPENMLDAIYLGDKRKLDGIEDYGLFDIIRRKDGGYVLVMESNKEFFRSTSGARPFRSGGYRVGITDYYNEDILVMSLDPNGAFKWNTILPKKQFSQDDDGVYSSFFVFKTPSALRFVYNDEIKSNNTVSEYVLNPAGIYERNSVLSTAYEKLKLRIRSAVQISSNSYLLTSERNNRLNIVKIEY